MEGNTEFQEAQKQSMPPESVSPLVEGGLVKGLEDQFNGALEQERKPGEPKIHINIFYSAHGSAKDFGGLDEQFRKASIYIPEMCGASTKGLATVLGVAMGMINPKELQTTPSNNDNYTGRYPKEFFEMIYNSQKPITFIDLPENHPILKRQKEIKPININFGTNFVESFESVRRNLRDYATLNKEREEYMLSQLRPRIQSILSVYPKLREKKEINVLLSLGAYHTSVYPSLKKGDYRSTREFSKTPFVYGFGNEAQRRYLFGKQVDDQLIARVVTEICLHEAFRLHFEGITDDSQKIIEVERKLVSAFSFDEIKNMFESVGRFDDWPSKFVAGLKQKGLRIPFSEKELDEFLTKHEA